MTWFCRAAVAALIVASLTWSGPARAEQGLVVILGPSSDHPTVAQVRNELLLLGFDVSVLWSAAPVAKLDGVGRRYGAAAVARVVDWPPEVVIWVAPERDGQGDTASPEIYVSDSLAEPAEHRLLALGAVELLRGRLLAVPKPTPEGIPAPPAGSAGAPGASDDADAGRGTGPEGQEETPQGRPDHRATYRLGPAVLVGPKGTPATPHVHVGASLRFAWRLSFDADVLVPTTPGAVSTDQGRIDLRTLLLTGGLSVQLTPQESAWLARAGLGAGAAGLFFTGEADEPYEGRDGAKWAFAPYANLVGGYYVHPVVAVRANATVAMLAPEPVVRIAGQRAATLGRPAVVLGVGVEVRP